MYERTFEPQRIIRALDDTYDKLSPLAYPLIRFTAGVILIPHGWMKLFGGRLEGTAKFLSSVGLDFLIPAYALAIYIALLELIGGALLAVGLLTRLVAIQVIIFMFVAAFYVHWSNGFLWVKGGYEYPLFWGIVALAILFRGGGPLSLDSLLGKEF